MCDRYETITRYHLICGFLVPKNNIFNETYVTEWYCEHITEEQKQDILKNGHITTDEKCCKFCGVKFHKRDEKNYTMKKELLDEKLKQFLYYYNPHPCSNKIHNNIGMYRNTNYNTSYQEDFILGISVCGKDEDISYIDEYKKIKQISEKEIIEKINDIPFKIPYDKNSFGLYVIKINY